MIPSYFKIEILAIQDEFVLLGHKGLNFKRAFYSHLEKALNFGYNFEFWINCMDILNRPHFSLHTHTHTNCPFSPPGLPMGPFLQRHPRAGAAGALHAACPRQHFSEQEVPLAAPGAHHSRCRGGPRELRVVPRVRGASCRRPFPQKVRFLN